MKKAAIKKKLPLKRGRAMEKVLKDEGRARGGFEMKVWRWKPDPKEDVMGGGIVIQLKSDDLEQFFKNESGDISVDMKRQVGPSLLEAPMVYNPRNWDALIDPWAGRDGLEIDGMYYGVTFKPYARLITGLREGYDDDDDEGGRSGGGILNLSFLRAKGLSEGVTFKLDGLYPVPEIKTFGTGVRKAVSAIYANCFKDVYMDVTVDRREVG